MKQFTLKLNIMKTSNVTSETLTILAEYKNTSLADIKNAICGSKRDRGTCWTMTYAFSALMRLADEKWNFVGKIIEDAFNGKNVSEKQAWCVAFFAKNNGLINA